MSKFIARIVVAGVLGIGGLVALKHDMKTLPVVLALTCLAGLIFRKPVTEDFKKKPESISRT